VAIRLVLVDVDGTLVGANGVHASAWDALARARAAGVDVALCTGRIGRGQALEYARRVAPEGLHVFQNGAVVSRPGQPAEFASRLPARVFAALTAVSRRERVPLEAYSETRFFLERHDALTRLHERHLGLEAELADFDALPEPLVRAQWVVSERDWPRYREWTLALGDVDTHPASAPWSPGTVFSNLTAKGTSKVSAMRWLASRLGFGAESVAMVGDGINDLEVMRASGLGIAMGNAEARVKAEADVVVANADAGGIAEAIECALSWASQDDSHVLPLESALDLHSFQPRDLPDVVRSYLEHAAAAGLTEVRLIHGRGIGVQRERVRAVLATHPAVETFADAAPDRGGWGATVVKLRPPSS
jgi:Cof subfamily protein (haloacid dehalogenase superfamily)